MEISRVAAVDVGGTDLKHGLVDGSGRIGARGVTPTASDPERLVEQIAELISGYADAEGADRFGVVTPGIVDSELGVVRDAANLGWREVELRQRLSRATGLPGLIGHDMRAAGLAEWRLGGARGATDFLFIALGTGIAAALVVDGHLVQGGGFAGELGHVRVAAAGRTACGCGNTGCLESVASALGVRRTHARLTGGEPAGSPDSRELAERARGGDPIAREAFDVAAEALAEALAMAVTLLGPETIVIGGGMAGAKDLLWPTIERGLAALPFQRRTRLADAELGSDAGLIGAGLVGAGLMHELSQTAQPLGEAPSLKEAGGPEEGKR